ANAYPPAYHHALRGRGTRASANVQAALSAGVALPGLDEYRRGGAVSADLTGAHFASLQPGLPVLDPREAGAGLARLARDHSLTFFDFWLSDRVGHRGTFEQ